MTLSPTLPFPVVIWDEPLLPAGGATRLAIYLGANGFWTVATPASPPIGSTPGVVLRSVAGFSTPAVSSAPGLNIARSPAGFVYLY